jgi:hypothetical protein
MVDGQVPCWGGQECDGGHRSRLLSTYPSTDDARYRTFRRMKRRCKALLLFAALSGGVMGPGAARAEERSAAAQFGLGAGSVLCTVVYGTVKTVYAIFGTLTGGVAWALTGGRSDVAREIIQPAVRGDYAVTPDILTGQQPLVFVGRDPAENAAF